MSTRSLRSAATAERIRDAAWACFSTRGYDEVTLAEVAERAGVSVPTVRSHFGRKQDLFISGYVAWGMGAVRQREGAGREEPPIAIRNLLRDYEREGKVGLHLLAEEDRFPDVRRMTDGGRAYHRWWLGEVFAEHLSMLSAATRERRLAQLTLATDLSAWKLLRLDLGLSARRTEAAILETVRALTGIG